jgi:hypothetical protein
MRTPLTGYYRYPTIGECHYPREAFAVKFTVLTEGREERLCVDEGLRAPLADVDPFGDAYFELRDELESRGIPIYRPLETS